MPRADEPLAPPALDPRVGVDAAELASLLARIEDLEARAVGSGRSVGEPIPTPSAPHRTDPSALPRDAWAVTARPPAQAELSVLADALVEGVIRVGPDGIVTFANLAAHTLLGRRPRSLGGRTMMEAFLDHRVEELIAVARDRGSAVADLPPRSDDDRAFVARVRAVAGGDAWVVLEDVTEMRRLQRIRAEFIGNLSHELRTPITNLSLLAESIARDADDLTPRVRERVTRIEVEAGYLAQMVGELLDLATIESGQRLRFDDVDLAAVARAQVERLRPFAERQGVTLVIDPPPEVPTIGGDEDRLGQALLNLLHNAVKFSAPGDVVRVVVEVRPHAVTVAVVDQGIGIARADIDRIFERFYKADRARRRGESGTGLGLAIVRHVVEGHGGTVAVESVPGLGSTFRVTIPRVETIETTIDQGRPDDSETATGIDP